ncbi:uncharacterized protein F5Z01DRAFT_751933 [Emericellopsis atlantica]|uniref:Protein CAP22 n=1 Tax=Emericellopsis atlantica TaxID=2614577 RepID=A0A9P7ZIP4_9HYPO|nr:uncharacterized protein F5Z01DRAFT_751933 [Emericellopsis atlantica]KAG9252437.1 hypothetical protein F5Z01DRAFT_751933 [Emericellopsis atlantica]
MHSVLIPGLLVILPALAEELRAADVPKACETICGPIVELTNTCDIDPSEANDGNDERKKLRLRGTEEDEDGDEAIEAECICKNTSFDVANIMALCASCIAQNGGTTEDADKIMSQCSFSSTSYALSATIAVKEVQVEATKPATALGSSTTDSSSPSSPADESNSGRLAVSLAAVVGISFATLMVL